jgi:hypothetical protein
MKFKTVIKISLLMFTGFIICILSIGPLRSQISQIAGLAVAQTQLRWNNVKDAAVGDDQTNGILSSAGYLFDGINWDRPLKSVHADNLTTAYGANTASFLYGWDVAGGNWDRVRVDASGSLNVNVAASSVAFPTTTLQTLLAAVAVPTVGATFDTTYLLSKHTWEIVITGAPANETTLLEGSINGANWYTLDTSNTVTAEMRHVVNKPVRYIRANCTVLPGGTCTVRFMAGGN